LILIYVMGIEASSQRASTQKEKLNVVVVEYCRFKPALFYQTLQPWHIADRGLDFKLNIQTGVNEAKYPNDLNLENGPRDRLDAAMTAAMQIVDTTRCEGNDGDALFVRQKLLEAASWGNNEQLQYILRSCYVTESTALPAFIDVCTKGFDQCAKTLLEAGMSPTAATIPSAGGNNCFHLTCQAGQEHCALLLIKYMKQVTDLDAVNGAGYTGFHILRNNDMTSMAKRLEYQATLRFGVDINSKI
jgi:hypothetical protein